MADDVAFDADAAAFALEVLDGEAFESAGLVDLRLALDDESFDFDGDADALLSRFVFELASRFVFELASDLTPPSAVRCFDLGLRRALVVDRLLFAALDPAMVHYNICLMDSSFMNEDLYV